ncbi:MAG: D-glycerate dehydrogenase, partial [Bacteroidetes bacterium]
MSKPRVYLTRELPPQVMDLLRAETLLSMNTADRVLSKTELKEAVKGQDALLCLL